MKIRIKGNSLRIRLTKSEVDKFGIEGYLEDKTIFANGTFVYALRSENVKEITANISGTKITMSVPESIAHEWTTTDIVGYGNTIATADGASLYLLLEKDFKCTDPGVVEDQSDNYEHPTNICAS